MRILRGCGLGVIAGSILSSSALAQERTIKRSDLPSGVEKTVAAQSSGATIQVFSQEREKGKIFYEAEMMINGHSKDVLMDSRGAIVEVEEQTAMDELPADVQDGLRTKAGKGKIVKIESITKHDKLVAYEAKISRNGERSEIQVNPHGKPLFHEQ